MQKSPGGQTLPFPRANRPRGSRKFNKKKVDFFLEKLGARCGLHGDREGYNVVQNSFISIHVGEMREQAREDGKRGGRAGKSKTETPSLFERQARTDGGRTESRLFILLRGPFPSAGS